MTPKDKAELDPLYVIFEQHLFHFQDSDLDRKGFIARVVQDYLKYLSKLNIIVPRSLEESIIEELGSQVHTMLVKRIYGCLTLDDYRKRQPKASKRRAKERYQRLITVRRAG